jgi:16S rRNA (adenine1518-N6/adenine1519-N6)-dimethyltransferase
MDPSLDLPPLEIGALLRAHQLHPKKGLGQNFLADPVALQRIVAAADIPSEAHVLEIGPGLGSLTRYLARAAGQVTAVELDKALLPVLQEVLASFDNVRIIQGDILELNPAEVMPASGYLVVANIPYYITSAVIRHLLEAPVKPSRIVLTVQREVAERICAPTGKLSLLALSVQVYGQPRQAARIPAGAFYPPPKVDSSVVRVDLYPEPLIPHGQLNTFFRLAKAGFSQKRKMLRNSLVGGLSLSQERVEALLGAAGISPQRRAETLSIEEWGKLTAEFQAGP